MRTLAERLDAAIRASGKTGEEIAAAVGAHPDTISRLRRGKEDNPTVQLLAAIAREVDSTVGALLGESTLAISGDDEEELLRFRSWIDAKLATIDARLEPNAAYTQPQAVPVTSIADRPRTTKIASPFSNDVHLVLRALGVSMIGAGILPDDLLHIVPPDFSHPSAAAGRIVACKLDGDLFVKRIVIEHRRLFLLSAHPRYRSIAVEAKSLEILGTVVGRLGAPGAPSA